MRKVELMRFAKTPDGVVGRLGALYTLEEEDRGNERNVSCIPEGTYICRRTIYHKHGYATFEVTGVPGRSRILFHPGNTEEDSMGCILPGMSLGTLRVKSEDTGSIAHKLAVASSTLAFKRFMQMFDGEDAFELTVREYAA